MKYFYKSMQPYMEQADDFGGGSDDFADVVIESEEPAKEPQQESTEEPAEDTNPAEPVKESPKVKLKYNHEEKEYSLDDVVPLAQKGLNYDKLQEKFNEIQNNPALSKYSKVQEVSTLLGYQSDDELLDALYNTYYQNTAESKGLTPEQIKKEHELTQKEKALQQKTLAAEKETAEKKMYADFAANFPDVKAEMIKPETWAKVANGMDLTAAYTYQQNQDLLNEIKTLKQNATNLKKAPISGGVSTNGSEMPKQEKIFEGFDD